MLRRTLLASACAVLPASRSTSAPGRTQVRVAVGPYLTMSPFYVGYEFGYFTDAGFDVELKTGIGSVQLIPLAAGGEVDVCFLSQSPPFLNAVAKGARIKIVAGRDKAMSTCRGTGTVYVRQREFPNGISDLRLLRGKKVALTGTLGGHTHFVLDVLLEHFGMRPDDVQVLEMRQKAECIAALRSGAVDALVSDSTDLRPLQATLQLTTGPELADVLPGYEYSYIMFGRRLLDADVRTGANFLAAYLRGAREYLNGKTPAFMDEFARSSGLDPKVVRAECRDRFVHDGSIKVEDLRYYIRWAAAKGYCPAGLDPAACIDMRFLAAMQQGH